MKSQSINHRRFEYLLEITQSLVMDCEKRNCHIRLIGSVGTYYHITRVNPKIPIRYLKDLDFIFYSSDSLFQVISVFESFGYTYNNEMLIQTEGKRLVFYKQDDPSLTIDLIANPFSFAKKINFKIIEFQNDIPALSVTNILLTRMQKVELSKKDIIDLEIFFRELPLSENYINVVLLAERLRKNWEFYTIFLRNIDVLDIDAGKKKRIVDNLEKSKKTIYWHFRKKMHAILPFISMYQKVEKFV